MSENNAEPTREIEKLLVAMVQANASDLHLKAGSKPLFRVAGAIRDVGQKVLTEDEVLRLVDDLLSEEQKKQFKNQGDIDLGYTVPGKGRYRINAYKQRGTVSCAVRKVTTTIPTFDSLTLPPVFKKIALFNQGLVLFVGITGSGKSTSLAAMIEYINVSRRVHIVTIEDPIEYLFLDKKSFIEQREVGIDVNSFEHALKMVVRQDPDVILCGEMRDPISFQFGLHAAETGHLVFGTLHASSAPETLVRILDLFEPERREMMRQGIAFNLKAIIYQKLLPSIMPEKDRVPAVEVLISNPTIVRLIREHQEERLHEAIRGGREEGMLDFTQYLCDMVNKKMVSKRTAYEAAPNPEALGMLLKGIKLGDDRGIIS